MCLAGDDMAKFGVAHLDGETRTQGALDQAEQFCSHKDSTINCRILRNDCISVFIMLAVSVMLHEKRSSLIVNS